MADLITTRDGSDIAAAASGAIGSAIGNVQDPDVRRALRAVHAHYEAALAKQQTEIEVLLETLLEKHITSIGEFKRQMARFQNKDARVQRLHEQVAAVTSALPQRAGAL
jgi:hypothetical protein